MLMVSCKTVEVVWRQEGDGEGSCGRKSACMIACTSAQSCGCESACSNACTSAMGCGCKSACNIAFASTCRGCGSVYSFACASARACGCQSACANACIYTGTVMAKMAVPHATLTYNIPGPCACMTSKTQGGLTWSGRDFHDMQANFHVNCMLCNECMAVQFVGKPAA